VSFTIPTSTNEPASTQRIFWSRVVRDAGYDVDWRDVSGEVNDAACHSAASGDLGPLVTMFDALVGKLP
jgi:cell filamentation protein